jgi:parallel beta-helix repeat protein
VNKCVTLRGEDRNTTIIDTEAVTIQISCNSTITGFSIKNGTYGIEYVNPIAPYIANNIFTEIGGTCIMVWDSSASPVISDNEFTNNYHNCIDIPSSAVISNNTFNNNGDGIFNDGGGIDVSIFISGSSSSAITSNIIRNNAAYGIVTSASSPMITNNIISGNERDIWDWGGSSFTIFNNTIADNEYGVYLSSSTDSIIYFNNFVGNARNAYSSDSSDFWNSLSEITYIYNDNSYTNYLGNYWDDYNGTDADNEGIGDTPYRINYSDINDEYPLMERFENYFQFQL